MFSDTRAREMVGLSLTGSLYKLSDPGKTVDCGRRGQSTGTYPPMVIVSSRSPLMFSSEPAAAEMVIT